MAYEGKGDVSTAWETLPSVTILNNIENLSFHWKQLQIENFKGKVEISTTPLASTIRVSEATVRKLVLPFLPSWFPAEQIQVKGTVLWDRRQHHLTINDLVLTTPQLGTLFIQASVPLEGDGTRIRIQGKNLNINSVLTQKIPWTKGFSLQLPVTLDMVLENLSSAQWNWKGDLHVPNGSFSDPSFLYSAEKLDFTCSSQGVFYTNTQKVDMELQTRISQGEALLDTFYFHFGKTPFFLAFKGSFLDDFQKLVLEDAKVTLDSVFRCSLKGSIDDPAQLSPVQIQLSLPMQAIEPFMNTFIRDPFQEQTPLLKRIQWGGEWMWDLSLTGSLKQPIVRGNLQLRDLSLNDPEGKARIEKLNGDIPLWFDFSGPSPVPPKGSETRGTVELKGLEVSWFDLQSLALHFAVFPNGFRLSRPVEIPLWEDTLKIQSLEMRDIFSDLRQGHLSLGARQLRLDSLFKDLLGQSIPATVKTKQWNLNLKGRRLESTGDLSLDAFSGNFLVENLRVDRFLSSGRILALDARWSNLDLEQLTRIAEFGKITGLLEGQLSGFEMSYGQPLAFDMLLRSVSAKGVPQRISVTAVDNLAQIGTAQSPFQGITGGLISTFFKDFYYEKIGVRCVLQNDTFSVRGLIREGDTEYLVKGSAWRGVNIVNRNPDNRIAWDDMVRRLKRVTRPKAPEQP